MAESLRFEVFPKLLLLMDYVPFVQVNKAFWKFSVLKKKMLSGELNLSATLFLTFF